MTKIRAGIAGCGFVAELHMYAYRRVYGVDVEVRAVAARGAHVVEFARRHQIPTAYRSFAELIADREIDVVDICTPPNLHATMIVEATTPTVEPLAAPSAITLAAALLSTGVDGVASTTAIVKTVEVVSAPLTACMVTAMTVSSPNF